MEAASLKQRMDFLRAAVEGDEERYQKFAKSIVREGYFAYRPLTDGMTLDLGGVSLTACMVPGHTKESFVFVDMERGDAFAGDSINPTPWIFPESGTSVEEYGRAVERFRRKFPEVRHLYSGHCMEDIGVGIIEDTLRCVKEILAGAKDPLVKYFRGEALEHRTGGVAMLYRKKGA